MIPISLNTIQFMRTWVAKYNLHQVIMRLQKKETIKLYLAFAHQKQERSPKKKAPQRDVSISDRATTPIAPGVESASQSISSTPTPVSTDTPLHTVKDDSIKFDNSTLGTPTTHVSMKKKESENDSEQQLNFPPDRTDEIRKTIQHDVETNAAFQNPLFNDELKYWLDSKRYLMQPLQEMSPKMVSQLESSLLNCPDSLDADSPCLYTKPLSLPHPTSIFFPMNQFDLFIRTMYL